MSNYNVFIVDLSGKQCEAASCAQIPLINKTHLIDILMEKFKPVILGKHHFNYIRNRYYCTFWNFRPIMSPMQDTTDYGGQIRNGFIEVQLLIESLVDFIQPVAIASSSFVSMEI